MSNIGAINQAPDGYAPAASKLVGQKPNPWFNVLATLRRHPMEFGVNIRNDMYLLSEGLRFMNKAKSLNLSGADKLTLDAYKKQLDHSTKFIPTWVKVAVAIALGLGTMIGWKRIVITVGERIGKTH